MKDKARQKAAETTPISNEVAPGGAANFEKILLDLNHEQLSWFIDQVQSLPSPPLPYHPK